MRVANRTARFLCAGERITPGFKSTTFSNETGRRVEQAKLSAAKQGESDQNQRHRDATQREHTAVDSADGLKFLQALHFGFHGQTHKLLNSATRPADLDIHLLYACA